MFYGLVLVTISLIAAVLWRTVARNPELLEDTVDRAEVDRIARSAAPSLAFYLGVILAALIIPQDAAVGYLVIAVAAVLTARGERPGLPLP